MKSKSMKSILLGLIGALLMFLAVAGGICLGVGVFAYGIYTIILLVKGTLAVTFLSVLKVVACWVCAGLLGWLWFFIVGLLGGMFLTAAKDF